MTTIRASRRWTGCPPGGMQRAIDQTINEVTPMSRIVAIVYPDEHKASEVLPTLRRLQKEYLLQLEDACVVVRNDEGKVRLEQSVNLTATGAVGGAFWGALVGLIFLNPLIGAAVGAAAGAVSGSLSDYGIDDNFMKGLSEKMPSGSSAIFMLIRSATDDKVAPEIAKFGGHVLFSNLSNEQEQKLDALLKSGGQVAPAADVDAVPPAIPATGA